MKKKLKQDVPATDDGVGASKEVSVQVQHEGVGVARSHEEQVLHREGSQRGFQHLHSHLLVEVFSYLPQTELFEVMTVCRPWEQTVMAASILWKEVEVFRRWDLGGRGGRRWNSFENNKHIKCQSF